MWLVRRVCSVVMLALYTSASVLEAESQRKPDVIFYRRGVMHEPSEDIIGSSCGMYISSYNTTNKYCKMSLTRTKTPWAES